MAVYELSTPRWTDQKEIVVICDCSSHDHQMAFSYLPSAFEHDDWVELYVTFHLHSHKGFFRRLWRGIRYAFGYRSRFGEWDELVLFADDADEIARFLGAYAAEVRNRRSPAKDYAEGEGEEQCPSTP